MELRAIQTRKTAGNEATGLLRIIALIAMFCDHAGKMLLPDVPEMRLIGRLAFPIYAWMLVVGAGYTRNMGKYILRILADFVLCQYLYMIALAHTTPVRLLFGLRWYQPNIMLTLALGLVAIYGFRKNEWLGALTTLLALILAETLHADYGWKGILFIVLLYTTRGSRNGISVLFVAYCLFWGSSSTTISTLFGMKLTLTGVASTLLSPWLHRQSMAILALPLILWRCPRDVKMSKWIGYGLYPAHLLVLLALEQLV